VERDYKRLYFALEHSDDWVSHELYAGYFILIYEETEDPK
jgi:hypothetical protein